MAPVIHNFLSLLYMGMGQDVTDSLVEILYLAGQLFDLFSILVIVQEEPIIMVAMTNIVMFMLDSSVAVQLHTSIPRVTYSKCCGCGSLLEIRTGNCVASS